LWLWFSSSSKCMSFCSKNYNTFWLGVLSGLYSPSPDKSHTLWSWIVLILIPLRLGIKTQRSSSESPKSLTKWWWYKPTTRTLCRWVWDKYLTYHLSKLFNYYVRFCLVYNLKNKIIMWSFFVNSDTFHPLDRSEDELGLNQEKEQGDRFPYP